MLRTLHAKHLGVDPGKVQLHLVVKSCRCFYAMAHHTGFSRQRSTRDQMAKSKELADARLRRRQSGWLTARPTANLLNASPAAAREFPGLVTVSQPIASRSAADLLIQSRKARVAARRFTLSGLSLFLEHSP